MYGYETRKSYGLDCFFLLPNGEFLLAEYNQGRISVHFELFIAMNDIFDPTELSNWEAKQEQYQICRIVPECKFMLLSKNQVLTNEQQKTINDLVNNYGVDIHYYECEHQCQAV